MASSPKLRIAIVTPTYRRTSLLVPFLRQVIRQDYDAWRLVIVHDGDDWQTRELVKTHGAGDARIYFANTEKRANDFGVTPRLLGVKLIAHCDLADYIVFWDDDNSFFPGALTSIVHLLEDNGKPPVLLVPIHYQNSALPRPVSPEQLGEGQIDMANFVVQSGVASRVYEQVWKRLLRGERSFIQDFLFLNALRSELGAANIRMAQCQPLGRYDGLRTLEALRWRLGIPYLGLSRFSWYRWLRQRVFIRD